MKIYIGLQLRLIAQIGCDETHTCTYINFNKSLDCIFVKTRKMSNMIRFMFVLLHCFLDAVWLSLVKFPFKKNTPVDELSRKHEIRK